MVAYLLLTRAAPMRLHRRRACGCVHTLLAALGACTHPHTQRLQGRTFLVRQSRLTPKHYPDGGVPSAHSRRTMRLHRRQTRRRVRTAVARAHICVSDGSKVEPFLCGKAAYMRKILYICSMVKNLLTFCRAFLVFLVDNKHCLWCIIHKKKWW